MKSLLLFPFLNSASRKLKPVFTSRFWLPAVLFIEILLYLPVLFTGFFADDNWHRLEFSQDAARKIDIHTDTIRKEAWNLYAFSGFNTDRWQVLRDKGIFPWWSDSDIRINFFRPLSSLTLAMDYFLWPDLPVVSHIHSPLVSGLPRNTILGFPGLAMAGFAAFLFYYVSKASKSEFGKPGRIGLKMLVPLSLFCFLIVGPVNIIMLPATFRISKAADTDNRCVVIINLPPVSTMEAGLMQRLFTDSTILKPFKKNSVKGSYLITRPICNISGEIIQLPPRAIRVIVPESDIGQNTIRQYFRS